MGLLMSCNRYEYFLALYIVAKVCINWWVVVWTFSSEKYKNIFVFCPFRRTVAVFLFNINTYWIACCCRSWAHNKHGNTKRKHSFTQKCNKTSGHWNNTCKTFICTELPSLFHQLVLNYFEACICRRKIISLQRGIIDPKIITGYFPYYHSRFTMFGTVLKQ